MSEARDILLSPISGISCGICITDLLSGTELHPCTLPCGHIFHDVCLKPWLAHPRNKGATAPCPSCRKPFKKKGSLIVWPLRLFFDRIDEVNARIQGEHLAIKEKDGTIEELKRRLVLAQENQKKQELETKSVIAELKTATSKLETIRKKNEELLKKDLLYQTEKGKFLEKISSLEKQLETRRQRKVNSTVPYFVDLTGDEDADANPRPITSRKSASKGPTCPTCPYKLRSSQPMPRR